MSRQVALRTEAMWSGTVDTEPGAVSGWHHHGDHDTTLYVVQRPDAARVRPGGEEVVEGGPGDFLRVPAGAVHRESNPGDHVPGGHRPLRHRHPDGQRRRARRRSGVRRLRRPDSA